MESQNVNFLIMVFVLFSNPVTTSRVLLMPLPIHSHCNQFGAIGESLTKRGHVVTAYIPQHWDSTRCLAGRGIDVITYNTTKEDIDLMENTDMIPKQITFQTMMDKLNLSSHFFCSKTLRDTNSIHLIGKLKFDIAIVDTYPGSRCFLLIPYRLKIPYVSMAPMHSWFDTGKPFTPNFEPFVMFAYPKSMTFPQRLMNALVTFTGPFLIPWLIYGDSGKQFAPELSFFEYISLIRQAELFLQDDDVIISGSLPVMPNTIYTGGFTPREPNPLPDDLEDFYSSATDGVIVVSFGTVVKHLPSHINITFLDVFKNLSFKVHWKSDIVVNHPTIKVSKWLPQNDVLGHENTKLFISHCGRNSFFEAVYHAVPTICIPFIGDQPSNANNLEERGFGVKMDIDTVTTTTLMSTIERVLTEASFKQNADLMSNIYRDIHRESAGEVAASAVEHVMKYGGDHLRPQSLSLSLAAFLMLDVWLFLSAIVCVVSAMFCSCCLYVRRFVRRNKQKKD